MIRSLTSRLRVLAASAAVGAVGLFTAPMALADSISPTSFSADLGVGDSVTVRKTVTVSAGGPTTAVLDVVFLFDTSGSMGPFIAAAKVAAANILAGLSAFGDLATATGYYSEPGNDGTVGALTTSDATGIANINAITLGLGGGGGDFPEEGVAATKDAADNTAWRTGSNRFIIALGDATFKESDGATVVNTLASLNAKDATFIGIDFANMTRTDFGGISPAVFATPTGGSIQTASTDPATIVAAIVASVTGGFGRYGEVTVGDLGGGAPEIGVSTVCVTADIGSCAGATATGAYDRSVDRTFTFDVTFTRLAAGDKSFDTYALVDRGIVATERDTFGGGGTVPEPGTIALIALSLLGLGVARRRKH